MPKPQKPESQLPWNQEAERMVLAGVLLEPHRFEEVSMIVRPEDFMLTAHQHLFSAMSRLRERGEGLDIVQIAEELNRAGNLEATGGYSFIAELLSGVPKIVNLQSCAKIVWEKAQLRRTILHCHEIQNLCQRTDASLPTLQAKANRMVEMLGERVDGSGLKSISEIIDSLPNGVNYYAAKDTERKRISTGFRSLDAIIGGFFPGELTLVGARPGVGKTSLAMNFTYHTAVRMSLPVVVFSLEMSKESLMERLACAHARINSLSVRTRSMNEDQQARFLRAMNVLSSAPIYIDDTSSCSTAEVRTKLCSLRNKIKPALVVIDYLQLMTGASQSKYESQQVEVNRIANHLKVIAKDLDVPIVACSQLSRAPELRKNDPRPKLSDLRDSGGLEQAADVVLFIFREELYKPGREDLRGKAEIIVAKQRNGPQGVAKLVFLHSSSQFAERTEEEPPPPERRLQ